jgi:phage shock protein E
LNQKENAMKRYLAVLALGSAVLVAQARDVVIDVRTPQEFASGHIAGALNIDYAVIGQEISRAGVAKDDKVILYCRSGNRSGVAQETLKKLGFSKAENYGGLEEARKRLQKP